MHTAPPLPFRQIHLDFHTSEHIPGVGADFDGKAFAATLQSAHVNSVTLFGKCHHGWSYYPTKIGTVHPQLQVPDLLGEMIQACRHVNIQTPVYLTVQWDELTARTHPEWRVAKAEHGTFQCIGPSGGSADLNQLDPQWHPLSVIHEPLVARIIAQAIEVIERYDPEGLFMDILLPWQDVSAANLARMDARGLDPEKPADRLQNDREVILAYYERFWEAIRAVAPHIRIFHNSGHIYKGERERWSGFTHLELESLPTGGWGYDHFPLSARYASELAKPFIGLTGKFHTSWGEFGGYKTAVALDYECAQMAALGARCSIGDQLHPCGKIDADTYKRIAPAYRRIQTLEPFLENATPVSDIGIISAEAHHRDRACEPSDIGAARILLESQQMFALLDWDSSLEDYRVLILPDSIRLSESQASRLQAYLDGGGAILSTGHSLLDTDNSEFAIECGVLCEGDRTFQPDYVAASADLQGPFSMVASPFVIYNRGISLHPTKARPLAHLHDPYFNRSWRHFCSHQHTPCQVEQNATLSAAVRYQSIIHFAHPLFKEYHQSGQPLTKALLLNGLRLLLPDPPIRSNLPTSARLSWMRQTGLNRDVLHVLFAQTQLRGTGLPAWNGTNAMEIIEDVVSLSDITVDIRPSKPLRTAYSAYQPHQPLHLEPLDNGSVRIRLAHLLLHEAIVLQYA